MTKIAAVLAVIVGVVALVAISFGFKEGSLAWDRHFKPKEENVKREVFLSTRSYNEAKLQELSKYRLEYLKAKGANDTITAGAIRSTIQHTFAEYDHTKLPPELSQFLSQEIFNY